MWRLKLVISFLFVLQFQVSSAQNYYTLDDVIAIALEKNHSIKISKNKITEAENSATLGNAGLLPKLSFNASGNLSSLDTKVIFTGSIPSEEAAGAQSNSLFTSIDLSYTVFDGFKNKYKLESLKSTTYEKTLDYNSSMEKTTIDVINAYYNLVNIGASIENDKETYNYSVNRYMDIENEVKYGQNTDLELLTAKGYINSDSSRVLNSQLMYEKAILDLNAILGTDTLNSSDVFNSTISLTMNIDKEEFKEQMLLNNSEMVMANLNMHQSELDVKSNKYFYTPSISLNASYGYGNQEYQVGAMLLNRTLGPSVGFTLKQNIFEGNTKRKKLENAKISLSTNQIDLEETKLFLSVDFEKAWLNHQYYMSLIPIEQNNVEIAKERFKKTQGKYKLGQVSSLEFRDAQLNLAKTISTFNEAKINTKLAEWELLRLAGGLLK